MKVYPVSRSKELTREAIQALEAAGHEVVLDWTAGGSRSHTEADREIAERDERAVRDCEALVMLWVPGIKAAFFELGLAYAYPNKRLVVVGADLEDMLFFRLSSIRHVATIAEAVELLSLVGR